ncbi:MAG: cell division protein ZapA [Gammaproteobacteria bacterium]|nr:cell division protein ZapA [Gammaproteobacteria bacterium]
MSQNDEPEPILINIFGKEYQVACKKEERPALVSASDLLDSRMREIRKAGKVLGTERVAVMAALNFAHELTISQKNEYKNNDAAFEKIKVLQEKIDTALALNKGEPK